MWSKRDILLFLAGAQVFHTISHIFLSLFGTFPMNFSFMVLTQQLNMIIIGINIVMSIILLWLIRK